MKTSPAPGFQDGPGAVSRLDVPDAAYNFLNNIGQWWTVNQAFLDSNAFFGSRFIYVTDPALVWSGSWYLMELWYLNGGN